MDKPEFHWEHKSILIAEDEPINYMLLRKILETSACQVLWAKNGLEAVHLVDSEHPDLILMDLRMPEMDGITATKEIRKTHPDIPIIAVTAFNLSNESEKCKEAGCTGFLTKPVMPRILLPLLDEYLGK